MKRACVLPFVLFISLACSGDAGPMGPAGPPGPPGPSGQPATMHIQSATISGDGTASVTFDGLQVETVVISCWMSETASGPWFHIGTDMDGPACGAANDGDDLVVQLVGGVAGWIFMVTALSAQSP